MVSALLPVTVGQIVAEKYQVDSVIGQGGMGIVMSAHHIDLDQKVAIKFLLADVAQHADAAERFRREARAAARIHSDHVVRVLDVGVLPDEIPYMVMEYLEGKDLGAMMAAGERFSVEEAVGYALEAIDAIAQAHKAGIVHRDLKPANLFLAKRPDGSHRIKVLDFGISKSLTDSSLGAMRLTSTTTLIGSPLYMSPEQMQSARDVDGRADIWSFGAILFEMLAARPPYQANTLPQLCQELLTADPPKLRALRADVPEGVENAVARCLMRNIDERWQDMRDVAAALRPFSPRHRSHRPELTSSQRLSTDAGLGVEALSAESPPGTLDPWGNTQARKQRTTNRRLVVAVPLTLLAIGGVAAFWVMRSDLGSAHAPGSATPLAPGAIDTGSVPDAPLVQESAPRSTPGTIVTPVDPSEIADTDANADARPPARVPVVRGPLPKPAVPVIAPAIVPPAVSASPLDPPSASDTPTPASDVSDFGGRR
ncbi:MAG TPA: protein kinase [Polyangiaceae bacterium]